MKISKVTAFLFLTGIIIFIAACEKDDEKTQTCKITKEAWVSGIDTVKWIFTYNADSKLIRQDYDADDYVTYTWENGKVTIKNYTANVLSYTEVVTLNSKGLAVSSTYTKAGSSSPKSTTEYEYDDDGYLMSKITTQTADANDIQTYSYEYLNGNLLLMSNEHVKTGYHYYSETAYEYYTDKANTYNLSLSCYGKPAKNLVKKTTLSATLPVALTLATSYVYELESNGNVKTKTMTISGSSTKVIPTYECK
jgi:hypothetical protein